MIRILTLLVSLFTFGLVQLADITYEIPVQDMLYFRDTPIAELNGLTLNEVFDDGNMVLNHDFSDGTTNWINFNTTFSLTNQILTVSNANNFQGAFTNVIQILENDKLYAATRLKAFNNTRLHVSRSSLSGLQTIIAHSGNGTFEFLSDVVTMLSIFSNPRIAIAFRQGTPNLDFEIDGNFGTYAINLTTLGIDNLTKAQLDNYLSLYQNPELNISYSINELSTEDIIILLASQSVWTISIHILYKYAYRSRKKSKRMGM